MLVQQNMGGICTKPRRPHSQLRKRWMEAVLRLGAREEKHISHRKVISSTLDILSLGSPSRVRWIALELRKIIQASVRDVELIHSVTVA